MDEARILLIPAAAPFADEAAQLLIAIHREELPDLSRLTLVVAAPAMRRPLRAALARAAGGAVLSPRIHTAQSLALERLPASAAKPLSALACRLRLAEWLTRISSVFPDQEPAPLADALFGLFEELVLNAATLPEQEDDFATRLHAAYAAPLLAALSREAQIVHRLWRAYVEEIGDRAPAVAYLRGLSAALAPDSGATPQYWLGFDSLTGAESALLRTAIADGRARFWTQGRNEGRDGAATQALLARLGEPALTRVDADATSGRSRLLDACFALDTGSARERASALEAGNDAGLRIVSAANAEHEARCVDLLVREALLAGSRSVAVVSADRRLARRLRALLERAGLGLEDRVGWALSTSRAAAALASWLECVETAFNFRALLDLLKCGFFADQSRSETALAARLEAGVLFGPEGPAVSTSLTAMHKAIDGAYPALFERLTRAAALLPVRGPARSGAEWAEAITASLKLLGLAGGLAEDEAGALVFATLAKVREAFAGLPQRLRWNEFRALLDRHLEDATFRPDVAGVGAPRVTLYTLEQTQGLRADALILASATRAQLPGSVPGEAFFNQSVRRELGLSSWPERQALSLARLRRLLEAAPRISITYSPESDGEPAQLSLWLEALEAFSDAAGYVSLRDTRIARRAGAATTEIAAEDEAGCGARPIEMPRPPAAPELLNFQLSASAHQALIDCPYRFHARSALRLREENAPDEAASRADFGDRVHLILRAFHQHHDSALPPPYNGPLTPEHSDDIAAKLAEIADAVFAPDLAARPLARTWRREFTEITPWLVEQLSARGDAQVDVEIESTNSVAGWQLKGRIDRLELRAEGATVIDYKTGAAPRKPEVLAGESVQLPHYALEVGGAHAVEYWALKDRKLVAIEGDDLSALASGIETRLAALRDDLAAGHAMPAHGDDGVCGHCEFDGLCRKGSWSLT